MDPVQRKLHRAELWAGQTRFMTKAKNSCPDNQRPLGQKRKRHCFLVKPEIFFPPSADGEPKHVLQFQTEYAGKELLTLDTVYEPVPALPYEAEGTGTYFGG